MPGDGGLVRRRGGGDGQVGSVTEGHEETLGGNGRVPDIDCGDVSWMYTYVNTYQLCILYVRGV